MTFFNCDIPCLGCGYNLRGLSIGHGCPECGLKVTSKSFPIAEKAGLHQIEDEIERNLAAREDRESRRRRMDDLIAEWEKRGERFDRLLDQIQQLADRAVPEDHNGD